MTEVGIADADAMLRSVADELHEHFEILHSTVQLESEDYAQTCELRLRATAVRPPIVARDDRPAES